MDWDSLRFDPTQGDAEGAAGAAAGDVDSGDWRTHILSDARRRIANKIMAMIKKHIPVLGQDGEQELMKASVRFEEKMYNVATSQDEYLRKIALMIMKMEMPYKNSMASSLYATTARNGQNAHGPGMTTEATSYETTSGPEDSDKESMEEEDGEVPKEDVVEEVVVTKEQNYVVAHKDNARVVENEISCGLSSGAKLDERLAQVEERLEKMEAHSEKVETLLVDINEKLNYLVKMQDAKVSRDIKRRAKHMSSSWTGNGRSKRKHRVAEMIRQSCKHRRLGRGDKTVVRQVTDQRKLNDEEQNI